MTDDDLSMLLPVFSWRFSKAHSDALLISMRAISDKILERDRVAKEIAIRHPTTYENVRLMLDECAGDAELVEMRLRASIMMEY